ncbi:MAG: 30S ribosomal protein S3 [Ruminococcaceae bacterium]|nr:30S ribosomal protein S3 [Oscillospiraceae bacterium]
MGQKVNPHGLRVGVIKDWDSRWFAGKATFGDTLVEDYKIREYIMKDRMLIKANGEKSDQQLSRAAGISLVEIERANDKVKVHIHTAKPGMLIGAKGAEIEKLRNEISKIAGGKDINLNIVEVKNPDLNAALVAENIAMQLEQRVSFRRAMKSCIGRTMKSGAKGIKTMVSGRLGGAEIARSESYHEGTIPLQTLRADIDYGVARANTTYGVIGVKVWIYKGEVLKGEIPAQKTEKPRRRNNDGRARKPRAEKKEGGNE